jgi:L-amino acid N-acyltransferase YncA
MSSFSIRSYRQEDRAAVRQIAFETGLEGNTIADQYADQESFADMFTAPYTDHQPENVLVVEQDGKVQGYACAAIDSKKVHSPLWYVFKHCLLRLVWLRTGTARFYWRGLFDALRDLTANKRPPIDAAKYPSHAHINLGPNVRGAGVAMALLGKLFAQVRAQGSNGIYAECVASNKGIAAVARKFGFIQLGEPYPAPGIRSSEGKRVEVVVFALDLIQWESMSQSRAEPAPAEPASLPSS